GMLKSSFPSAIRIARNISSQPAMYATPLATPAVQWTGPPVLNFQIRFPLRAEMQYKCSSYEPTRTLSPTTTGEDLISPPVLKVHALLPSLALTECKTPFRSPM